MRWQAAHRNNAIERVSLTFQFGEPVPKRTWHETLDEVSQRLPEMGFRTRIDMEGDAPVSGQNPFGLVAGLRLVMGPGGLTASHGDLGPVRIFKLLDGSQIREEISFRRDQITYSVYQYDRWNDLRNRVFAALNTTVETLLRTVELNIIKLEYWDRFTFTGSTDNAAYKELLRSESRHLPRFFTETPSLWHSHVGYFLPANQEIKRLINLNVDVADIPLPIQPEPAPSQPEVQRSVGIYSLAQDQIDAAVSPTSGGQIFSLLDDLHAALKKVFADVITPEAADLISLNTQAPPWL